MNNQKNLSLASASKISQVLDLSPEEEAHLMRLAARDHLSEDTRSGQQVRSRILKAKRNAKSELGLDSFQAIAEWHHFAIIALINTKEFRGTGAWIGKRLGIPPEIAKESLDRLLKLGLITKEAGKFTALNNGDLQTPHDVASRAIRENHRQHLVLAEQALATLSPELLEFENCSIPMLVKDVAKAQKAAAIIYGSIHPRPRKESR